MSKQRCTGAAAQGACIDGATLVSVAKLDEFTAGAGAAQGLADGASAGWTTVLKFELGAAEVGASSAGLVDVLSAEHGAGGGGGVPS